MTDFRNSYRHGFARVATVTHPVRIADPAANAEAILGQVRELSRDGVAVALFGELGLVGYAIEDLVLADAVLEATETAIARIAAESATCFR